MPTLALCLLWGCGPTGAEKGFTSVETGRFEAVLKYDVKVEIGVKGVVARRGDDAVALSLVSYGTDVLSGHDARFGGCSPWSDHGSCASDVAVSFDRVTEWWTVADEGVHQGWTLHQPPTSGDVSLRLAVVDGRPLRPLPNGAGVLIEGSEGNLWSYSGLRAWDVNHAPVPASLSVRDHSLVIRVAADGAQWPIVVDPILAPLFTDPQKLLAPDGAIGDGFGTVVDGAGDVNADGFQDVVIGAFRHDLLGNDAGAFYWFEGSSSGININTGVLVNASDGVTGDEFGGSVAGGMDLNGDGFGDVVIGAPKRDDQGAESGAVYVYFGSLSGIDSGTEIKITHADMVDGDQFGEQVASAGDVDGDGFDDFLVSARYHDGFGVDAGVAFLYYGGSGGLSARSAVTLVSPDISPGDDFGGGLSGAGDVNGDGYDDVLVGASLSEQGIVDAGAAYVFMGGATGLDSLGPTKLTASDGTAQDYFGIVAGAGDVNGDGFDDVLVAAGGDTPFGTFSGAVYVYLGSAAGVVQGSEVKVTALAGAPIDAFGFALQGVNDIDNDGFADFAVGAQFDDEFGVDSGAVYVFFGDSSGIDPQRVIKLGSPDPETEQSFGCSVSGSDTDGDGVGDILIGAFGDTTFGRSGGAAYVFGGGCRDLDNDGACSNVDCDDLDTNAFPGAVEVAGNGIDEDCDGAEVCFVDLDGDGHIDGVSTVSSPDLDCTGPGEATDQATVGDCDDNNPAINISAVETVGDEVDSDCDNEELCFADGDADGFTDGTVVSLNVDCGDAGEATGASAQPDCDDNAPTIFPGAVEIPGDESDSDCDGTELCFADADDDGFTAGSVASADLDCRGLGESTTDSALPDCDDINDAIYPGATDVMGDGVDSDCDGTELCFADADDDGFTDGSTTVLSSDADCDDAGEGLSTDATGECDDNNAAVFPGADELCDGVDNDCDGTSDNADALDVATWYLDADADGFGDVNSSVAACDAPADHVADGSDCDDANSAAFPGAEELCADGVDTNCDGLGGPGDDEDEDGASWTVEKEAGSDPCEPDTDGDGLLDGEDPKPTIPVFPGGSTTPVGCACATGGGPSPGGGLLVLMLGLVGLRRRSVATRGAK